MDVCFFFFKQKTAYEMCGRDWSSDVCSSDLILFWTLSSTEQSEFDFAYSMKKNIDCIYMQASSTRRNPDGKLPTTTCAILLTPTRCHGAVATNSVYALEFSPCTRVQCRLSNFDQLSRDCKDYQCQLVTMNPSDCSLSLLDLRPTSPVVSALSTHSDASFIDMTQQN